jgi:uncharacterized membrane protein
MFRSRMKIGALIGFVAAAIGLVFATLSTLDYAAHLDRGLHDVHCSFIPGVKPTSDGEACRAAMYSPYSALLKESRWGGIPISLFALGAFTFYLAFSVYLLVGNRTAPRKALGFFGVVSFAPLTVSVAMLVISLTKLGQVCKTCAGIYVASVLLALAGAYALTALRGSEERARAHWMLPLTWLVALSLATLAPAVVYAASAPDHRPFLTRCGELKQAS